MSDNLQHISDIPAHIFGSASRLSDPLPPVVDEAQGMPLWFIITIAVTLALYLAWLNHWSARGDNHSALFKLFFHLRNDYFSLVGGLAPSFNHYTYTGMLTFAVALWIMVLSSLSLTTAISPMLCGAILIGILLIFLYQLGVAFIIEKVVESRHFLLLTQHLKGVNSTIAGIIILPTALCYALTKDAVHEIFLYIIGFQLLILTLIYIYKTFMLFLSKKVSVLHTILYLCGVEIFPITLVWGFFCR